MSDKKMTGKAAARIQGANAKQSPTGGVAKKSFPARAQKAVAKNGQKG